MTGAEPRSRATVREVPRSGTWDNLHSGPAPSRAVSSRPRDRSAMNASPDGLRVSWRTDPTLRIIAAIAVVIFGSGLVFGLTAGDFAIVVSAVTAVVVVAVVRAGLAMGAELDGPGQRAFAAATHVASGAVFAAMAGSAVVIVLVFGARLVGGSR